MTRMVKIPFAVALAGLLIVVFAGSSLADRTPAADPLMEDFRQFLSTYTREIKQRDGEYLATVHPDLPETMHDFFFDATLNMMKHAETNTLQPSVACKEYGVCTVTWPQPNDSWAAQSFIRHEGKWRWLSE